MTDPALAVGVAQWLNAAALGTYKETEYASGDGWPILLRRRPQRPDFIISVSTYGVTDSPHLSDSVVGVQLWVRGDSADSTSAERKLDDIFRQLHGITNTVMNGVHVVSAERQSSASLGGDDNGRWQQADNYYFLIHKPTPHRS